MRAAGLFAIAALCRPYVVGAPGEVSCYADLPLEIWPRENQLQLQASVRNATANICHKAPQEAHGGETVAIDAGSATFNIWSEGNIRNTDECTSAFMTIVLECFETKKLAGGHFEGEIGGMYGVVDASAGPGGIRSDDAHGRSIMIRAGRGGGRRGRTKSRPRPRPAPKKKPTPKKNPTRKKKPAPKSTLKSKPNPTRKPSPTPKPTSKRVSSSKISSSSKPTPTKTCKRLYALKLKEATASEKKFARVSRGEFVGSRVQIEKRSSPKKGWACKDPKKKSGIDDPGAIELKALPYPDRNDMDAMTPMSKFYGFTSPETCDVFAFPFGGIPLVVRRDFYQVEHVLEWQTVTDFFSWIGYKKKANAKFPNPDPNQSGQLDFCKYWKATWTGKDAKAFSIGQSTPMTVEEHLKDAYPSLQQTPHEFVWLEKTINSPPKANMWAWKNGNEQLGIFNRQKMIRDIAGTRRTRRDIDKAKESYLDLKYLLGARRYMRSPAIAAIMKKQVNRMGDILDKIDRELPSHPKEKAKPWVSQGMGALWKEYMEERFRIANSRTEKDMDEYLKKLRDTWSKGPTTDPATKHFAQEIGKLHAEWTKEKRIPWKKPW